MSLQNTHERYGTVSKIFHWLIALLVLLMLCVGISFHYIPRNHFAYQLMFFHKSIGVTILGLMVLRLLWRWINPVPHFPDTTPTWQKISARSVHFLFYIALIAMPITGIVMSVAKGYPVPFWWFGNLHLPFIAQNESLWQLMVEWHAYLAWAIGGLYALHTLAALKHHFKDKDGVFKRMWWS